MKLILQLRQNLCPTGN